VDVTGLVVLLGLVALAVVVAASAGALGQDIAGILGDDRDTLEDP
jgi:hypothetical protein